MVAKTTKAAPEPQETQTEAPHPDTDAVVDAIIRRNMYWSMGAGAVPVFLLDTAALIAVQVKMLRELAIVYDVPFKSEIVRGAIGTLLSSTAATGVGAGVLSSGLVRGIVHSIPLIGPLVGLATMPAFYAAFTYATGKVFQQHFASGGTFLTFDPKAVEAYFKQKFEEQRNAGAAA